MLDSNLFRPTYFLMDELPTEVWLHESLLLDCRDAISMLAIHIIVNDDIFIVVEEEECVTLWTAIPPQLRWA